MLNLKEYRGKPDRITDLLPWAALIAPGIALNKDGSLQRTFRFRGPDLDSATKAELVSISARLNNTLRRFPGGWALFCEAHRHRSLDYPDSLYPDRVSYLIDQERKHHFLSGEHYESDYFLTLLYLPPSDTRKKFQDIFITKRENTDRNADLHVRTFETEINRTIALFAELMPETHPLSDDETLTYLHSCVSPKRHIVRTPDIPMYLDAILADSPLTPGFEPMLGNHHLRAVTIRGFPGASIPGLLDNLNRLNFEYRWVTRFLFLDKLDAEKELRQYKRKWFSKRKTIGTIIKEILTKEESAMTDNAAVNKAHDADAALQELADDLVTFGYFTQTVVVSDKDYKTVQKKVEVVEKTINSLGFTTIAEHLNAVEAWLGTLPGHCYANVRRPILNTLNVAHLFPLSAVWAGPQKNDHLNAPVLLHTETTGNTPFRLNLHVSDVGHTMIIGPTGSGKSVLLATFAVQFRKYEKSQVYIFDKAGSSRAVTAGVGGDFYDLGQEGSGLSFQPLASIDDEHERVWASEWILDRLTEEKIDIMPEIKSAVWTALTSLAQTPLEQRTLTGFTLLVQDPRIRAALEPYTLRGPFGKLFDAAEDTLMYARWQAFETERVLETPRVVPATLTYLFHRLEKRFSLGIPSLLALDEAWIYFDHPLFAQRIREWLKVLRKKEVSVVFSTQSLFDVKESPIASVLLESCPTQIFLPNEKALDPAISEAYRSFGLNDREIGILAQATPKRHYYYRSPLGSRLFDLALGPLARAYVGASSPEDQRTVRELLAREGKEGFNIHWLNYKRLPWAGDLYESLAEQVSQKEVAA